MLSTKPSAVFKNLICGLTNLTRRSLIMSSKDEKKQFLKSFEGGSVDLELNKLNGIAVMTINDIQKKNAMTGKMMVDLEEKISELERWEDGWGLILKGEGQTFCSGGNIKLLKSLADKKTEGHPGVMSEHMQLTLDRLYNLPLLSVALLEGATMGGGCEIAISCDFRIMSSSALFGFVQGRIGLCTGWGGTLKLVNLVGERTALKLLASCDVLKSTEALSYGLVDGVFTDEQNPMEAAYSFLKNFSEVSPEVLKAIKKGVKNASKMTTISEYYEAERKLFQQVAGGPVNVDALNKFLGQDTDI